MDFLVTLCGEGGFPFRQSRENDFAAAPRVGQVQMVPFILQGNCIEEFHRPYL